MAFNAFPIPTVPFADSEFYRTFSSPEHFDGDLDAWLAHGENLVAPEGRLTISDTLTIPNGTRIAGRLSLLWTGDAATLVMDIGDDCEIEEIDLSVTTTLVGYGVTIGTGFQCKHFKAVSTIENDAGFVQIANEGMNIGLFETKNLTRPLTFDSGDVNTQMVGGYIGTVKIETFIRGLSVLNADGWRIGQFSAKGRATGASKSPGHNGILLNGASDWIINSCDIDGAAEHGIRSGGGVEGQVNSRWQIGTYNAANIGGCPLKCNQAIGTPSEDWSIGSINVVADVDTGDGRNSELVRLTGVRNASIGTISHVTTQAAPRGHHNILALNNVVGLHIGAINAAGILSDAIRLWGEQDDEETWGPIDDIQIGTMNVNGCTNVFQIFVPAYPALHPLFGQARLGTLRVGSGSARGYTTFISVQDRGGAWIANASWQINMDVDTYSLSGQLETDPIFIDITQSDGRKRSGHYFASTRAFSDVVGPAFSNLNVAGTSFGNFRATTVSANAADGDLGGAYTFGRPGSPGRRGAAIAVFQDGADANNVGINFYMGSSVVSTDEVGLLHRMRRSGDLDFEVNGRGIVLKSPDGLTRKLIRLSNAGVVEIVDP